MYKFIAFVFIVSAQFLLINKIAATQGDPVNTEGWPALHRAIKEGNHQLAREIIELYPEQVNELAPAPDAPPLKNFNAQWHAEMFKKSFSGISPLELAIDSGSKELVDELLQHGADINRMRGITIPSTVCQLFLSHFEWTAQVVSPLYLAIKNKDKELVDLLIERGAKTGEVSYKVNCLYKTWTFDQTGKHETKEAFQVALEMDDDEMIRTTLYHYFDKQISLESIDDVALEMLRTYKNPKVLLAENEDFISLYESINEWKLRNAELQKSKASGWPDLHHAIKMGQFDLASLIANLYPAQVKLHTPFNSFYHTALNNDAIVLGREKSGLPLGQSALELAIVQGATELVEELISYGANVNEWRGIVTNQKTVTFEGREQAGPRTYSFWDLQLFTPLFTAIKYGRKEVIRILVEKGASTHIASSEAKWKIGESFGTIDEKYFYVEKSAFQVAFDLNQIDMVKVLIAIGAGMEDHSQVSEQAVEVFKKYPRESDLRVLTKNNDLESFYVIVEYTRDLRPLLLAASQEVNVSMMDYLMENNLLDKSTIEWTIEQLLKQGNANAAVLEYLFAAKFMLL